MKKKGIILVLIILVIVSAAVIFYSTYIKYDDVNYTKVEFEKDLNNETFVITMLVPNYFEKKLEYELINKLEETLKNETDPEKKHSIERRLQTETYYYGYDEFQGDEAPPRYCSASVRSLEKKSDGTKPERDYDFFMDYYNDDTIETVDIETFSYKFKTVVIKKYRFENFYYIFLENDKFVLEIYTALTNDTEPDKEAEYLNNLIKAVDIQLKPN